jgi:hypothetical protein
MVCSSQHVVIERLPWQHFLNQYLQALQHVVSNGLPWQRFLNQYLQALLHQVFR